MHLSLLSAFASRVDLSAMSARCLLAYHHPYGLMAICKKFPFITRFSTLVRIGGGGGPCQSHTRSRHFERVLAMYTKPRVGVTMTIH